jgi:hypothetical protein
VNSNLSHVSSVQLYGLSCEAVLFSLGNVDRWKYLLRVQVEAFGGRASIVLYVDPNSIRRLTTERSEARRREAWAEAKRRR